MSVISNLNDPHKQEFLRGHDDNISRLTMSKSVRNKALIATRCINFLIFSG